eukprot:791699-Pelagomonas_calceolata.AAC.9
MLRTFPVLQVKEAATWQEQAGVLGHAGEHDEPDPVYSCPSAILSMQLSVEDNELKSLAGIEPLVNLMELYAGK